MWTILQVTRNGIAWVMVRPLDTGHRVGYRMEHSLTLRVLSRRTRDPAHGAKCTARGHNRHKSGGAVSIMGFVQ